jgi:hypothetical protein
MGKKQTAKTKVTKADPLGGDQSSLGKLGFLLTKTKAAEVDPLGELMTAEFVEKSFNEAIEEVRERQRLKGQDSPCAVGGRLAVKKPDGRIVFKSEKTDG